MLAIPTVKLDNVEWLKSLFEKHIDRQQLEEYRLPVRDCRTWVIVGLSGGADSSVLALLSALYLAPHYANLRFLFTDTKAEPTSCYETLDAIEALTGIHVERIIPEKGLFELIEQYNGFLPNSQARWCTRQLKIDPLVAYLATLKSEYGYLSLAGIRYDEPNRDGIQFQYQMAAASAAFPFVDLKVTKDIVFDILHHSIGIPGTYRYRNRSGCFNCFFQRNQEAIGMLYHDPAAYAKTESAEKLCDEDAVRWNSFPPAMDEIGFRGYYPVPAFVDLRKPERVPSKAPAALKPRQNCGTDDLFGGAGLDIEVGDDVFVAFALYVDRALGWFGGREFTPGVYWQEFITISTSLNGLKTALGTYYRFKRTTPVSTIYQVKDLSIVIAQIRFPKGVIDTAPPSKASYTWKPNIAYKQLRHLTVHCQAMLHNVDLKRQLEDALAVFQSASGDAKLDAFENLEVAHDCFHRSPKVAGILMWEGLYIPAETVADGIQLQLEGVSIDTAIKPARENLEYDEVPMACIACSV